MSDDINAHIMEEMGKSGLIRFGGFVFEEFLRELQGPKGMAIYREMIDNDPTIGAALFAIDQLVRKVQWRVDPGGDSPEDLDAADFLQSCMDDMSATWTDTISEILSMIGYGFSFHEIVYKYRTGANPGKDEHGETLPTSKYEDGRLGWRRLPIRSQESLWQWKFGRTGSILAMVQRAAPEYNTVEIPMEKGLLFRHRAHKNNPEGRSALRNTYRPWYFKKKLEVIEAIGIERETAGLPVVYVPAELLQENATPAQKALLAVFKRMVTNIRMDEQGGIVMPLAYDKNGNKVFDLSLLSTNGKRSIDTNIVIQRYDAKIAQTLLADLLLIGNTDKGSFALMKAKIDLFNDAITGWLDSIQEVFNRHAVPRLFNLNGFTLKQLPKLAHGEVGTQDLKELADYMTQLTGAGAITPTPQDEGHLREAANLPAPQDDDANMAVGN